MTDFYKLLKEDPKVALFDVNQRRALHRLTDHDTVDEEATFDCAECGVLDRQHARAEKAAQK